MLSVSSAHFHCAASARSALGIGVATDRLLGGTLGGSAADGESRSVSARTEAGRCPAEVAGGGFGRLIKPVHRMQECEAQSWFPLMSVH